MSRTPGAMERARWSRAKGKVWRTPSCEPKRFHQNKDLLRQTIRRDKEDGVDGSRKEMVGAVNGCWRWSAGWAGLRARAGRIDDEIFPKSRVGLLTKPSRLLELDLDCSSSAAIVHLSPS